MSFRSFHLSRALDWGGLSARQLALRTYQAIERHDTLDRAAIVAFYALLSLVPLLGFLLAIAFGAADGISGEVLTLSNQFLPSEADAVIHDQVRKIRAAPPVGLLTFSFAVLLWSSSGVFIAVMDGTNAAHGVRDRRPWWRRRLLATVLTTVELVLLLGAFVGIVAEPSVLHWFGLGGTAAAAARWIAVVLALLINFSVAYYFGPDVEREWEWVTPGSAFGVVMLIATSLGFRLYLYYGWGTSETFGVLGGVVILLLWFYLAALALLVGAEMNCVIEYAASPGVSARRALPMPSEGIGSGGTSGG